MKKILGLDIGIASVGYGIIDDEKILDKGVRSFSSADASANVERRGHRGTRRLIRRKRYRLQRLEKELNSLKFYKSDKIQNPYELRVKGLSQKLEREELFTAIYNLGKHRGISYLEDALDEKETSDYSSSININKKLINDGKYPCEIQLDRYNKYGALRGKLVVINDSGNEEVLLNIFTTSSYINEAKRILSEQQKYYPEIKEEDINIICGIIQRKRKYYEGPGDEYNRTNYGRYKTNGETVENIFEELIGKCTIYPEEHRAPSASYSAQEFNLLNDLNNLIINRDSKIEESNKLTKEEKEKIIEDIFKAKTVNMINIIKKIAKCDKEDIKGYRIDKDSKSEFHKFEQERKLRSAFENSDFDYENLSIDIKNDLGYILTLNTDYEQIKNAINKKYPKWDDEVIKALSNHRKKNSTLYSRWHSLSFKAMNELRDDLINEPKNQMILLSERGLIKSNIDKYKGYKNITSKYMVDNIYNPVVRRSINQTVKIINKLRKKHGEFEAIVIEMPRDTNAEQERKKITKMQSQNEKTKKSALIRAKKEYNFSDEIFSKQKDFSTKLRLWYEQDGYCAYTGERITIQDLSNNPNQFEIDHIIPKSISLDDSLNNKVLVTYKSNQQKGQKTPFQYFKSSKTDEDYNNFKDRMKKLLDKKDDGINKTKYDLLTFEEDINKYEVRMKFINRNLNDTRHSSKVTLNEIHDFMKANNIKTQIHVVRGKFTSSLRKRWNVDKNRDESNAHHGVDALIVASTYLTGQSENNVRNPFFQKLNKQNEEKRMWKIISNKEYDKEVYKEPFDGFIDELKIADKTMKYSHKVDTKVNRAISNATIYSTRKYNDKEYIISKYKDIYNVDTSEKIKKIYEEEKEKNITPSESKFLIKRHDPKTWELFEKIIETYGFEKINKEGKNEKINPFLEYKKEHGYIRKYSKKGNGAIIKDLKYVDKALGSYQEINKGKSKNRQVLLQLNSFRTDVYYDEKNKLYKCLGIKYNDFKFEKNEYVLNKEIYFKIKEKHEIIETDKFLFSLYKNDIIEINKNTKIKKHRFLSKEENRNRINLKPIEKNDYNDMSDKRETINSKIKELKKYRTNVLGDYFEVKEEKLKMTFKLDDINDKK